MSEYILSILIFLPLLAMLVMMPVSSRHHHFFRIGTLIVMALELGLTLYICCAYDKGFKQQTLADSFQLVERYDWLTFSLGSRGSFSIDYFVGLDGLSLPMILLSSIVFMVAAISSWTITKQVKGYHMLLMLLTTSVIGCFLALDLFLFYVFFEFMLLPMFFLIGIWGGARREYASLKFFIYTLVGSLLILTVMIGLYLSVQETGAVEHTFSIPAMMDLANYIPASILGPEGTATLFGLPLRLMAFLAVFIGFAIKLPAVPFHTWLPDAHVEAPTAVSVILAGILLKVGGYGLMRIGYGIFPEGGIFFAEFIGGLGVLSIIYAGFVALAQHDLKRLVAYSSVSHMGFVLLGLGAMSAEGVNGAIYQMFSHGIVSAALFLICGVLYDRTGDRIIENFGGLQGVMPKFTAVVMVTFFASLGLPGLSNFIGELLVLLGAFAGEGALLPKWMPTLALLGIVLSAAYFLWALQRMFFGKYWRFGDDQSFLPDLTLREMAMFVPLCVLIVLFGLYPSLLLERTEPFSVLFTEELNRNGNELLRLIETSAR